MRQGLACSAGLLSDSGLVVHPRADPGLSGAGGSPALHTVERQAVGHLLDVCGCRPARVCTGVLEMEQPEMEEPWRVRVTENSNTWLNNGVQEKPGLPQGGAATRTTVGKE